MRTVWLGLCATTIAAIGCGAEESDRIVAGERAQGLGVSFYKVERAGEKRIIRMFTPTGPGGVKDFSIGELELTPLKLGDVWVDDQMVTEADLERHAIVRARFRNEIIDRDVGTFLGKEKPGLSCPRNEPAPQLIVENTWHAALADEALAPFLAELDLVIVPAELPNFVQSQGPRELAFDGDPHVGDCDGHRVLKHAASGYTYTGCWPHDGDQQRTYNWDNQGNGPSWVYSNRVCWGGSAQGGNGQGNNCCNSNCSHPSPSGTSTQPDCGGFSANGCYVNANDVWGCSPSGCGGPCYDNCGNYTGGCDCY